MKYSTVVGGMILAAFVGHKVGFRKGYLAGSLDLGENILHRVNEDRRGCGRCRGLGYDNITFESRSQAESVLSDLKETIKNHGRATVSDLLNLSGMLSHYTDAGIGWYNLDYVPITRIRAGYILDLPRAMKLV